MERHEIVNYFENLKLQGGPQPADYPTLHQLFDTVAKLNEEGQSDLVPYLHEVLSDVMTPATSIGLALTKPYGYAGDYIIMDRIYTVAWDLFFHSQPAVQAVHNRKTYLHNLLDDMQQNSVGQTIRVLNVGSGPGRDILEYLQKSSRGKDINITCVDHDPRAIEYAKGLLKGYSQVEFVQENALRLQINQTFDLIWCAGLFDYLSDRAFKRCLRRLFKHLSDDAGSRLVVGNFSTKNPSRNVMTILCEWLLYHRTPEQLRRLAADAQIDSEAIWVDSEPLGINLFLNISKRQR